MCVCVRITIFVLFYSFDQRFFPFEIFRVFVGREKKKKKKKFKKKEQKLLEQRKEIGEKKRDTLVLFCCAW